MPALRSANIREDGIDPSEMVFITEQSNALLSKSQVREGDVLTVRTDTGNLSVVDQELSGANCIDILITRPGPEVRPHYLASWINSTFGKEQVLRKQGGLAQQHFNVSELRELLVALPDVHEQDRISERIADVTEQMGAERALAMKYRALREGLMGDLLVGRVPVSGHADV